jgi:hypothetical protein
MSRATFALVLLFASGLVADGQEPEQPKKMPPTPIQAQLPDELAAKAKNAEDFGKLMETTADFAKWILLFGGGAIVLVAGLGWQGYLREQSVVRLISLVFLATLAGFLIIGGYSQGQIGSAMTLLGTLAGYIFARQSEDKPAPDKA